MNDHPSHDRGRTCAPDGYGEGIDRVMRAALADGAAGVVWVTLNEERSGYRRINAYSAGKPWFGPDGLHLSASGASALAGFLRPDVIRAAGPRRPRLR